MQSSAITRELVFCPHCYQLAGAGPCRCEASPIGAAAALGPGDAGPSRFTSPVDTPRTRLPTAARTRRLVPALAGASVVVLLALIAVIVSS